MFSKIQLQKQQHLFQHSRESQTSEDDYNRSSPITAQKPISDCATIETLRRPRGRPPGSKNRPKPQLIITRDPQLTMNPNIFEITSGSDIVESIARFSHRRNIGLCILTASGTVVDVTLRQPSVTPNNAVKFHGRFEILSISATFIAHRQPEPSSPVPNGFFISLAGPQGQILGGFVVGPLLAAGTVFVTAASFNNPSYHKLPLEDDVRNTSVSGGGEMHSPAMSGSESGRVQMEPCIYSSHLASEVIWAAGPPF